MPAFLIQDASATAQLWDGVHWGPLSLVLHVPTGTFHVGTIDGVDLSVDIQAFDYAVDMRDLRERTQIGSTVTGTLVASVFSTTMVTLHAGDPS